MTDKDEAPAPDALIARLRTIYARGTLDDELACKAAARIEALTAELRENHEHFASARALIDEQRIRAEQAEAALAERECAECGANLVCAYDRQHAARAKCLWPEDCKYPACVCRRDDAALAAKEKP